MPRNEIQNFQDIPNVGKAMEKNFILLGIKQPIELASRDPYQMYDELCRITNSRHDPCVIDVFLSVVDYMKGGSAKKWWEYTRQRKIALSRE